MHISILWSMSESEKTSVGKSMVEEPERFTTPIEPPVERTQSTVSATRTTSRVSKILSHVVAGAHEYADTPEMGGGKDYPPLLPDREPYRVDFLGPEDPEKATNWPIRRKLRSCIPLALAALCASLCSAIYAPAIIPISKHFHIGTVPATLGVSLYVVGFSLGPVIWGPMSELVGRKIPLVLSFVLFTCFAFATATAKDVQTLIICRFFTGASGSAPIVLTAAAFTDLFSIFHMGRAIVVFSNIVIGGPMLGPIMGGYIVNSYLGWRWVLYISGIFGSLVLATLLFMLEETYAPVILARKAREIRHRTNNWGIYAAHELVEFNPSEILEKTVLKPLKMLAVEPILLLLSLFHGYVYGLLYMCLEAVPLVFVGYGWKGGNVELSYIPLFIGALLGCVTIALVFEPRFFRVLKASGKRLMPEERLPPMMLGTVCFSLGIFWFFWTGAYPHHVHWLAPIFALVLFGFGFLLVFIPPFMYIIDSYLMLAASAMAANAFVRGAMGAGFPLFTVAMFNNLGIQWAGTLIGCLSLLLMPMPFLFYKFGSVIRRKSKFAINMDPN